MSTQEDQELRMGELGKAHLFGGSVKEAGGGK